ncbi:MAG: hypothetical protein WAN22_14035 [Solirubrobacteraceae bacterium]
MNDGTTCVEHAAIMACPRDPGDRGRDLEGCARLAEVLDATGRD